MSHLGLSDTHGSTSAAVNALFTLQNGLSVRSSGGHKVVRISSMDHPLVPRVIDVLSRGECGTKMTAPDPLLDWVYTEPPSLNQQSCAPLNENPTSHRLAWFKWLAEFSLQFGVARGGAYALLHKHTSQVVAAAVTAPPHTVHNMAMSCHQSDLRRMGMDMAIAVLTHPRMSSLGRWQQSMQQGTGLGLAHLNIIMLATAPEFQGTGCGSALLRCLCDVADADKVPSLLETAGKRNVAFYSKKGGYAEYGRNVSICKGSGGAVSMMRRSIMHSKTI